MFQWFISKSDSEFYQICKAFYTKNELNGSEGKNSKRADKVTVNYGHQKGKAQTKSQQQ